MTPRRIRQALPIPRDVLRALLPLLLLVAGVQAAWARDWYSAGHGDVDTRAFVVEIDAAQVQALLPSPLTLNKDFPGRQAGTHPVIFLFSVVMPRKAHLMPILIDMPYREFAAFVPEVRHPQLQGVFIHSTRLYLDSRTAVWIGQWPYRFPKTHARLDLNEGMQVGEWRIFDADESPPVVRIDYTLAEPADITPLQPQLQRLDDWFSLPLLNGSTKKFTCARMDWEIHSHGLLATAEGRIGWRDDWLSDGRRLPAPAVPVHGLRLQTLWYLSMPFDCDRYRASTP